ncbi:MAG: FkbM family methyltransferase [Hoeflea sp.]|uniref:FkbM family methyltransferase n=1 Tax=Hoeflea sp. TaxID=1940281 RepID=UPI003EF0CFF3
MAEAVGHTPRHAEINFEGKSFVFSHADEKDHIYSIIKSSGEFYEQELLSALRPLLSPGDWVVDAGANIGNHSVYFAGVCGCNVIAFEPNPVAASILRKNIELNGLENQVQVHEIALGSQAGTGTIVSPDDHNLGMAEVHKAEGDAGTVQIGLLSDYVGTNRIRLIKIDAEGMDVDVLRGAASVIERDKSAVSIEASSRDDFLRISGLLEPYSYTAAGSFNYTPTHLFLEDDGSLTHRTLSLMSRQSAMDYIDHAALRDALNRDLRQARTQRDQFSRTLSEFTKDLPVRLSQVHDGVTSDLREFLRSEMAALDTRLASIDAAMQAVVHLSKAAERSDARLDAIEQSIARWDERQAARDERNAAATSAISEKISDLQGNIENMAQIAVLWAETGHLQDAAQSQAQAQLQQDVDRIKQEGVAHGADASGGTDRALVLQGMKPGAAANAPADKGSVWRVVRKGTSAVPASAISGALQRVPEPILIANETFSGKWDGIGWATGKASLDPGGIVRATSDAGAGFVTQKYPFADGGLLEIEIDMAAEPAGAATPVLSIVSDGDEGIGPETALGPGTTTVRAFAPGRTGGVKLRIHARNARTGDSFAVRRLIVRRISLDAHQRDVRTRVGEPVLASMASIPSRRTMLADAVNSLLAQCDRVRVFLNNYPDVPDFLLHPRVDVRRSQDWDDRGDAGKMFWLEHDKQPGYRLIVDDDLIFPPDFSDVMCGKVAAKGKRAIYATHGVLVRQPVSNYYDNRSRAATFHFGRELPTDRRVHIGATNALCMHSSAVSMRWDDFKYCNSADVWLALHAQENDLQVLTPARRTNWVRENQHAAPEETIYKHSLNKTRTRFDSSLVQDAVLKQNWPLTIKVGDGHKYALLLTLDSIGGLGAGLERFLDQAASETTEWVVLLAFNRSDAALEEAVAGVRIERETHLIDTAKGDALAQANALMTRTGIEALLAIEAGSLAGQTGGGVLSAGSPVAWGASHMVKLKAGKRKGTAGVILAAGGEEAASLLAQIGEVRLKPSGGQGAFASIPSKPGTAPVAKAETLEPTINSVFEQVRVLNLDRRSDRWESVSRSLALADIKAERFSAVDGSQPEVAAEYEAYLQQPPVTVSDSIPAISSQRDFYMDYTSQMARIAHLERSGKKAIASRGAWGYLKSSERLLEEALADNTESLLILDDDVMLHKDIKALFAEAMTQLPDDWLILQLGTLQYNWTPPWAEWHSPLLYRTNGSAVGSHAVGMRFDVIPYLLDQVRRLDMPYDIGALSAATRAFPDRCFVIHPNLAIQSLVDSDIGTSNFQQANKREEAAARYRWKLEDYQ